MNKARQTSTTRTERHMPRGSGMPLYRFVRKLGALFGLSRVDGRDGPSAYEGEAAASMRSVDRPPARKRRAPARGKANPGAKRKTKSRAAKR